MDMDFRTLAGALAAPMGLPAVTAAVAVPMGADEQGYSGAALCRVQVTFAGGASGSFVAKRCGAAERLAAVRLYRQGRGYVPAAAEDGEWLLMEDIRPEPLPASGWQRQTAEALASFHLDNLGKGEEMPFMPPADRDYWENLTCRLSVGHFAALCRSDGRFGAEYGARLPALRRAAERFCRDMAALYAEGEWNTLTHGDLASPEGRHIRARKGRPCIIDWGFCRYGPLFADLAGVLDGEGLDACWEAFRRAGVRVSRPAFLERAAAAAPYPGFAYLYPAICGWQRGDPAWLERCLARLIR